MRLIFVLIWLWLASSAFADGIMMGTTGTAGGGGGGGGGGTATPAVTWDTTFHSASWIFSNGNLTATWNGGATQSVARVTTSYSSTAPSGKIYIELTMNYTGTPCCMQVGFADNSVMTGGTPTIEGGGGVAYKAQATTLNFTVGGPPEKTMDTMTSGSLVAFAIDFGAKRVWAKIGCAGNWNAHLNSPSEDPNTGVGGWSIIPGTDWSPSGALWIGAQDGFTASADSAVLNDGPSFACTVPTGYSAW